MGCTIRTLTEECKFCEAVTGEALSQVVPAAPVHEAVSQVRRPGLRVRPLTLELTRGRVVALDLFPRHSSPAVRRQRAHGQRLVWPAPDLVLAGASALVYRRSQLGVRPLAGRFHTVCRPLAPPQTVGAFRFGRRLVGIDGTSENVPDRPANGRAFSRRASPRGRRVSPQGLAVEVGERGPARLRSARRAAGRDPPARSGRHGGWCGRGGPAGWCAGTGACTRGAWCARRRRGAPRYGGACPPPCIRRGCATWPTARCWPLCGPARRSASGTRAACGCAW
jgi:Insertion element 4 transposase N-terminal